MVLLVVALSGFRRATTPFRGVVRNQDGQPLDMVNIGLRTTRGTSSTARKIPAAHSSGRIIVVFSLGWPTHRHHQRRCGGKNYPRNRFAFHRFKIG